MSRAAPVAKPIMTECDIKLDSSPSRITPMINWIKPAIIVMAKMYGMSSAGESDERWTPETVVWAMVANRIMEMALVGPAVRKREEPHNAATMTAKVAA